MLVADRPKVNDSRLEAAPTSQARIEAGSRSHKSGADRGEMPLPQVALEVEPEAGAFEETRAAIELLAVGVGHDDLEFAGAAAKPVQA